MMHKRSYDKYAPKIDRNEWTNTITRKKKPQEVHPAPNHEATNKYMEMMFRGWKK